MPSEETPAASWIGPHTYLSHQDHTKYLQESGKKAYRNHAYSCHVSIAVTSPRTPQYTYIKTCNGSLRSTLHSVGQSILFDHPIDAQFMCRRHLFISKATSNKGIATRNKCIATSSKKLPVYS